MKTVTSEYLTYLHRVVAVDAPEVQKLETKRAFMAGAWAMLMMVKHLPDELTEDENIALLQGYQDELEAFHKRVAEGHG